MPLIRERNGNTTSGRLLLEWSGLLWLMPHSDDEDGRADYLGCIEHADVPAHAEADYRALLADWEDGLPPTMSASALTLQS